MVSTGIKNLGIFLKDKRIAANFSQAEVAKKLGHKTPQFISNWERGLSYPPVKDIKTLAVYFKISPDELFEKILECRIAEVREEFKKELQNLKKKK